MSDESECEMWGTDVNVLEANILLGCEKKSSEYVGVTQKSCTLG